MVHREFYKPGDLPPTYQEVVAAPQQNIVGGGNVRPLQTSLPWWNPRYWTKRIWIGVVTALVIIIVIAVAVGVTQAKKNAYPNYSQLSYSLKETCELEFESKTSNVIGLN